jgi:glycogen operon protein
MRHAGMLRVDHVLGLARQFWVPRGTEGADGAYVTMDTGVLMAILAIESSKASCMIVGEDLGTVPEGFRERLAAANILSSRMLWFEQDQERYLSPMSYPRLSASCLSSHDLPTFKGWRQSASQEDVEKLERALSDHGYATGDLLVDAHAFVAGSPSAVMMIQADDLSGETEPLNVPGTDLEFPNWRRRLAVEVEDLAEVPATRHVVAAVQEARPRDRVERS